MQQHQKTIFSIDSHSKLAVYCDGILFFQATHIANILLYNSRTVDVIFQCLIWKIVKNEGGKPVSHNASEEKVENCH